ncbi:pimeloyl-ACP methyl ester carboxylesterase [Streptosporangium becharense]|uniref:Pimeloyl-ACP methyl ester carboxylesterase n=1 Tax=Streptosporangium becharense TaxID=1816182 RepID=A0A7W9MIQ0_9ACTN|nr:alpha/beta hydrolase [Streptosporangium becharense]MBB2911184.1 pimeloyl-ACP methyl ester carboxylesterase [Streptosporangium becharense]MBB5821758.1 pimeloyl-ACP methyl ester carboxylesterase [Streptosporangium becharense]
MTLRASANGIEIAYDTFGSPGGRPLLLVMGLGSQMIHWDEEFCGLLAGRGHHVVRFDNRDIGESTHLHEAGAPVLGGGGRVPYLLDDMADDTAGLLDVLGWDAAHVVGVSMGGMIAQSLAIRHPHRVRSLTSIMSTPSPQAAPPTDAAMAALMSPPSPDRETAIRRALETWKVIGSPGYPFDHERIERVAGLSYDRSYDPAGTSRQLAAILASADRAPGLKELRIPALVLHGEDDQLVPLSGGIATADAIPGARLVTFPGMGHDLPRALWPRFVEEIDALTAAAER